MPARGYIQDPKTGVIRLRVPRLRGKAAVKAAKKARQTDNDAGGTYFDNFVDGSGQ
jgi:hypothetical protein